MYEMEFLTFTALIFVALAQISYFAAMVLCLTIWKDRLPRLRHMEFALSLFGLGMLILFLGGVAITFLVIYLEAYNASSGSSRELTQLGFLVVALLVTLCGGTSISCFCLGLTRPRRTNPESHQTESQHPQPEKLPWQD